MGASKRTQMASLADEWPDDIWAAIEAVNAGQGASWRLAAATLAVTGCRPAALEKGVTFTLVRHEGKVCIQAAMVGVKLTANRDQPQHVIRWISEADTHRPKELLALTDALIKAPNRRLVVRYDAEAISTRLREISRSIWPRRKHHVTGYCYRELLSSVAKAAGVPPEELAAAMGHRSTESQGAYARAKRVKTASRRPWASVDASASIRTDRSPMARFKASASLKKRRVVHG